jgi:hypothetical protein
MPVPAIGYAKQIDVVSRSLGLSWRSPKYSSQNQNNDDKLIFHILISPDFIDSELGDC